MRKVYDLLSGSCKVYDYYGTVLWQDCVTFKNCIIIIFLWLYVPLAKQVLGCLESVICNELVIYHILCISLNVYVESVRNCGLIDLCIDQTIYIESMLKGYCFYYYYYYY